MASGQSGTGARVEQVECIVAGAGVVGLAIARALALRGIEVVILDAEGAFGTATSSRNSEVIHAGIYYPPGSLKARLCLRGRDLLYAYCADHAVPHRRCGKLIVATAPDQQAMLETIRSRAIAAGAGALRLLPGSEAMAMEPALACHAALHSPLTGIVDSHALMLSLLGEAEAHGAVLSLRSPVSGVEAKAGRFVVESRDPASAAHYRLGARLFVNAAGLAASEVARSVRGLDPARVPQTRYARGSYFGLQGRAAFSRLIYPVPEPGGLGVHLTLDLAGAMRFGPDVEWIPDIDYRVSAARRAHFEAEIRKYWPALPRDALAATYCGIRPKLSGPGEPPADFRIDGPAFHGIPGLVNLFGIESPGLTAALAIAERVAALCTGPA